MFSFATGALVGLPQRFHERFDSTLGLQLVSVVEPGGSWDAESLAFGVTPAIITHDVLANSLVTNEDSYVLTVGDDAIVSFDPGGGTTRQTWQYDFYRWQAREWFGLANAAEGNQSPTFVGAGDNIVYALPRNSAITPIDLTVNWTDFEGDAITITAQESLFGSLNVAANMLNGSTPDENRIDIITFRGLDPYGAYDDGDITLITGKVTVPGVVGQQASAGQSQIEAAYLNYQITVVANTAPAGEILAQNPAENAEADPFDVVQLTVSGGGTAEILVGPRSNRRVIHLHNQGGQTLYLSNSLSVDNQTGYVLVPGERLVLRGYRGPLYIFGEADDLGVLEY